MTVQKTTERLFPNRTWPWRAEDNNSPEALEERERRPEPPYHWESGVKVYHAE